MKKVVANTVSHFSVMALTWIILAPLSSLGQLMPVAPPFVAETLAKHGCWQSNTLMSMGAGITVNMSSKKWAIKQTDLGLELNELSFASLHMISEDEAEWGSATVRFPAGPTVMDVANIPANLDIVYSPSGDRIIGEVDMGFKLKVLFFPVSCEQTELPADYKGDIGFGEAPFGLSQPPAPYETSQKTQYIHHKKNSVVFVRLDEGFPDLFVATVKKALGKWNQALGWEVYQMTQGKEKLDALECLTTHSLCLFWEGKPGNLGWIGWGGLTGLNFDPVTGEIIGSTINFTNGSPGNLPETPKSIVVQVSQNLTLDLAAQILLRKEEFRGYAHPFPQQLFESLILHEMGHANGMKHDFRGSLGGSPMHPSNTVMEYIPFVVVHNLTEIGSKDIERLKVVYGHTAPKKSLKTCSDAEAAEGMDPNCLQNDLGEPSQWYMRLANLGEKNVFSVVSENQSGMPPRFYIDMLAKFLDNVMIPKRQTQGVVNYLCRLENKTAVQTYLVNESKKTLLCP